MRREIADYRAEYTKEPNYDYNFEISSSIRYGQKEISARVNTDKYDRGFIYMGNEVIPIDLIGKGKSKAMKKAKGILQWWIDHKEKSPYVHPQKRASQRARKRLRNASRRSHTVPSYARDSWYSRIHEP